MRFIPQAILKSRRWNTAGIDTIDGRPTALVDAWGVRLRTRWDAPPIEPARPIDAGKRFVLAEGTTLEWQHAGDRLKERIVIEQDPRSVYQFRLDADAPLDLYHQPALTQAEVKEGNKRPPDVVGSYAVYSGGRKLGHLYRPWAEDAAGDRVWCELRVQKAGQDATSLAIHLDGNWVWRAKLPIVIDPTFGYTDRGASNGSWAANVIYGHGPHAVPVRGTATSIVFWANTRFGQGTFGLYRDSDAYPGVLIGTTAETARDAYVGGAWNEIPCSIPFDPGSLWIGHNQAAQTYVPYDNVLHTMKYATSTHTPGSLPDPFPSGAGSLTRAFSIYCVYENLPEPPQPFRVAAGQVSHTGAVAGESFVSGARAGRVFRTGPVAGQIHG